MKSGSSWEVDWDWDIRFLRDSYPHKLAIIILGGGHIVLRNAKIKEMCHN